VAIPDYSEPTKGLTAFPEARAAPAAGLLSLLPHNKTSRDRRKNTGLFGLVNKNRYICAIEIINILRTNHFQNNETL
jgi:hypothetical protein